MAHPFLDHLLPHDLPVPHDRPFTYAEARGALGGRHGVRLLVRRGLLVSDIRGVYRVAALADSHATRLASLRLLAPPDAVVCDRSAAWLHGAEMALAPGSHMTPPPVDVFLPRNARLAGTSVRSGARGFTAHDLMEVDGLRMTTPLRTACDVGRLLPREQAFAVMDGIVAATSLDVRAIILATPRFRGYRGVVQLRDLAPRVDGLADSPPESILKLRWQDCTDLPRPVPQFEVRTPLGPRFIDLAVPDIKYGAEYFGDEFHSAVHETGDDARLDLLRTEGWTIDVLRRRNLFGVDQDWELIIRSGIRSASQAPGA
jgi:hypothetical protein